MTARAILKTLGAAGLFAAALGLAAGARVTVSAGGVQANAELAIDDGVPAQTCVIHAGSALAARLPASATVKLGSA